MGDASSERPPAHRHAAGRRPAEPGPRPVDRARRRRQIGLTLLALVLLAGCLVGVRAAVNGEHRNDSARRAAATTTARSTPGATAPAKTRTPRPVPSQPPAPTPFWQHTLAAAAPALEPAAAGSVVPSASGLASVLTPLLADPALAHDSVGVVVADPSNGAVLYGKQAGTGLAPASTAKLAVAAAALEALGPTHRFSTQVVDGATAGSIVLVGGGDPTLAGPAAVGANDPGYPEPATLTDLAASTAAALKAQGRAAVSLGYDASLFTGAATAPGWRPSYITEGDVAPVSALEVDEGRPNPAQPGRTQNPALLATQDFAALLAKDGISVTGVPAPATVAAHAAAIAQVTSPTVAALVQRMLGRSDNDIAEALARQMAIRDGQPATFAAGAAAIRTTLGKLGVDPVGFAMVDASGLSHTDRVFPTALTQVLDLVVAGHHPELASMLAALPVAGFSGTLDARYLSSPAAVAAGVVRAKTGTLDGTSALAGYLDDGSGRLLTFAFIAGSVPLGATASTEAALDRLAAGLVTCGCH
jgi:D-alanyl-D-alanine carboxypeptidase/D-alanyl-D-alanine-endopeptidase (penicillin-binding protein 4)